MYCRLESVKSGAVSGNCTLKIIVYTHVVHDNGLTRSFRPLRDKVWIVNAAPLAPAGAAPLTTSVLGEKSASAKAKQCSELLFC